MKAVLLIIALAMGAEPPAPPPFAKQAAKVKVGSTRDRVRALLGEPREPAGDAAWSYRDPPNQPDGPYHWYRYTFVNGKVSKIEDGGVACVLRE